MDSNGHERTTMPMQLRTGRHTHVLLSCCLDCCRLTLACPRARTPPPPTDTQVRSIQEYLWHAAGLRLLSCKDEMLRLHPPRSSKTLALIPSHHTGHASRVSMQSGWQSQRLLVLMAAPARAAARRWQPARRAPPAAAAGPTQSSRTHMPAGPPSRAGLPFSSQW